MAQKFVTLPPGTARSSPHMAAPIIDQNNLVVGLTASGGDTYPLATYTTDPVTGGTQIVNGTTVVADTTVYTWAAGTNTKPPAAGNANRTIRVSDIGVGGCHLVSDGTYWRPVGGSILLGMQSGSLANPVQSLTGNTGATFTSAITAIPAGFLIPGAQLDIQAHVRRVGANGTANFNGSIGTSGTAGDANLWGFSMAATTNLDFVSHPMVDVYSATVINTSNWMQVDGPSGSGAASDVSSNFNIASAMSLIFYTSSANAADTFSLIKYRVRAHF